MREAYRRRLEAMMRDVSDLSRAVAIMQVSVQAYKVMRDVSDLNRTVAIMQSRLTHACCTASEQRAVLFDH